MSWTLLANGMEGGANGATVQDLDTQGADLLIVVVGKYSGGPAFSVSDSKSNSWSYATIRHGNNVDVNIYYAWNPGSKVDAAHDFILSGTGGYSTIAVQAWSGSDTSADPLDQQNGAVDDTNSLTSFQPGSITPSDDGYLVVSGLCIDSRSTYTNDVLTVSNSKNYSGGNYEGGAAAYLAQVSAAAINPTWSWTGGAANVAAIVASFKAAAGAPAGGSVPVLMHARMQQ